MQGIRRQEQERRVAPIDGRERPRVRPGGRRDQPDQRDPLSADEQGRSFEEELAAREEAGDSFHPSVEQPLDPLVMPEDRLELHGRPVPVTTPETPAEGVGPGHVDVRV